MTAMLECVGGPLCGDELEAVPELNRYPVWCVKCPPSSEELALYNTLVSQYQPVDTQRAQRNIFRKGFGPVYMTQSIGACSARERAVQELTPAYMPYCHPKQPPYAVGAYLPVVRVTRGNAWHALGFHRLEGDEPEGEESVNV